MSTFEAFFRANYAAIVHSAARVLGDSQLAQEVASEAFVRLHREGKSPPNPVAWLKRCAARLALDRLRSAQRRIRREESAATAESPATPEALLAQRQERDRVRHVLTCLAIRDAEILLARAEGASYQEIAEHHAIHPASVGKTLSRAETAFREKYEELYGIVRDEEDCATQR